MDSSMGEAGAELAMVLVSCAGADGVEAKSGLEQAARLRENMSAAVIAGRVLLRFIVILLGWFEAGPRGSNPVRVTFHMAFGATR